MTFVTVIIVIQYTWIPSVIRTVVTVHVCWRFGNPNSFSYRLRLVAGFTNRTKEIRKLRYKRTR